MALGGNAFQEASARERIRQVHERLPDQMVGHEFDSAQDGCLQALIRAGNLYPGDLTTAMAWRAMLLSARALTAEKVDGRFVYRKAEFPKPLSPDEMLAEENRRIREHVAREKAMFVREQELAAHAQAVLRAPEDAAKRADFLHMCKEVGLDAEALDVRIEAAVERAVAKQLGSVEVTA